MAKKGENAFIMFHGKRPTEKRAASFYVPKNLIRLGTAVEVVYRCSKRNGGGDGRMMEYIHKFSPGTVLYMDERRGKMLYIKGSRLKVTDAGIEN